MPARFLRRMLPFCLAALVCAPAAAAHDGLHADTIHGQEIELSAKMAAQVQAAGGNGRAAIADGGLTGPQLGTHRVLVIPVSFTNTTRVDFTTDAIRDFVFHDVASYFHDESYGRFAITGDVVPSWTALPIAHGCQSPYTTDQQAEAAAAAAGFNPAAYDHIVLWMSYDEACPWAGLAQMPGRIVWTNAPVLIASLLVHEISHNLGSHHASTYNCPVPLSQECEQPGDANEYGDPLDPMGSGDLQTSVYNKAKFGWLPIVNQQIVTSSGLYALAPMEVSSHGVQMLTIPRGDGSFFYLEFRQPLGSDSGLAHADSRPNGVLIRIGQETDLAEHTFLVNTNQGSAGADGSALQPGQTLVDWRTGIAITGVSYTPSGFAVKVVLPTAPLASAPAVFAPEALQGTRGIAGIGLSWAAEPGAAGYLIFRDKTLIAETTPAQTSFVDPADRRLHHYELEAVDAGGGTAPIGDAAVAQVPLASPARVQAHRRGQTVFLSWQRVAGATSYSISRNGRPIGRVPYPSFTDKNAGRNAHYVVQALDQDGSPGRMAVLVVR